VGLFIYETRDTFDTTSVSETVDGGLCNALDVVTKDLVVVFSSALSETLGDGQQQNKSQKQPLTFPPFPRPGIVCDKVF
jgi:hypothetical protein